jgi:hypothetical protein
MSGLEARVSRSFLQRERRLLAHSRDGGRPSWQPVIGVVLQPLWHQGHKGQPMPQDPRTATEAPGSGGRTHGLRTRPGGYSLPSAIVGRPAASRKAADEVAAGGQMVPVEPGFTPFRAVEVDNLS